MKKFYDGIKVSILICGNDLLMDSPTEFNDVQSGFDNIYLDEL